MARLVPVAAAAAVLAIAGCTSGTPAQSPASPAARQSAAGAGGSGVSPAATIRWHSCNGSGGAVRCASLRVPLDYQHPAGRKITLALDEVPATAPQDKRQGVLLVNPGGPGASGLTLASQVAGALDPSVAARYDIIGFDTRGVGSSVPAITCDPSFFAEVRPDYIPASKAAEQVLVGRARGYAASCEQRYGWLLPFMTTQNIARDMDSIRAALGQQKISYFAYSYGTYIGQVYATLFPSRVHRMVLDSTVDPNGVWYADNISQDYAFQGRMKAFFAWVARYNSLYRLGSTPAQVSASWYQARNQLKAHPIGGSPALIGADEYDDTFLTGGYSNGFWPILASALSAYLRNGAAGQLVSAFDEAGKQNANEFAVYNAVECADVNWPRNWAKWDADTRKVYATAPFEAWDNAWFNAACAFWPVHGPARSMKIGAPDLPGILMLQGSLDAATPYAGAQNAHRALPSARMVVVTGGGNHGQSLSSPPNGCVNNYLNDYLSTGALPHKPGLANATCPALPPPAPGG